MKNCFDTVSFMRYLIGGMNYKIESVFGYHLLLCLLFLSACQSEVEKDDLNVPVFVVDFSSVMKKNLNEFPGWNHVEYILLRDEMDKESIGCINKAEVSFANNKIILMDSRMRALAAYDSTGHFISMIGSRGQGPMEYINLADFDMDSEGNIYVIDGTLDKLLVFDNSLKVVSEFKLSFEADVLYAINRDSILYGLSSWNKGDGSGDKIALVHNEQGILRSGVKYNNFDPNFWISDYLFGKSKDYISYNQTVDNDVLLFSHKGDLKKIIRFDFGDENVPVSAKVDIERQLDDYDHYVMIQKILGVTRCYVIGILWEHRRTRFFILDYQTNVCYLGDEILPMDNRFGCGYSEGKLVSYIDEPNEEYPDSVNNHVQTEYLALQIHFID